MKMRGTAGDGRTLNRGKPTGRFNKLANKINSHITDDESDKDVQISNHASNNRVQSSFQKSFHGKLMKFKGVSTGLRFD